MTLDEFIADARGDLERFRAMWRDGQSKPEDGNFPEELSPGEWFDQLLMFVSTE